MQNNNKTPNSSTASSKIFPKIDLGEYILREQTEEDAQDFLNYYSDPAVSKYIISFIPKSIIEAKAELGYWMNVFKYNDGIYFGIARKDNNQLIGSVGISSRNRDHNRIEASYDLSAQYWGRGIMTKALWAVLKYGFEKIGINRIEAFAMPDNIGSVKVLQKCGFFYEGNLRQHRYHNGKYVDIGSFSILHEDYYRIKNGK
jgi:ribosomal-protein-alanine N-acetyltransferase